MVTMVISGLKSISILKIILETEPRNKTTSGIGRLSTTKSIISVRH